MNLSHLSFLSGAERITLETYQAPRKSSLILSEVISRLAAFILLSSAAALDITVHTFLILPTFVYAIGKSIYQKRIDFTIPWQHLQRVRNSVAPLFLGSVCGLIHPFAGIAASEPTDKHIALGMLSSNTKQNFETPCSPIHSLSIIEKLARDHQYAQKDGIKTEIFSPEHIKVIHDAKNLEESLESLQAQEYIHKITNMTLFVMAFLKNTIENSRLSRGTKEVLVRASGLLIPILTMIDTITTLIAQSLFLIIGTIRKICGRGPIYTEPTSNPLMIAAFLIQNILKSVGTLIGTPIWFISPMTGFKVSLLPSNLFFKLQLNLLMWGLKIKLNFAKEGTRTALPIVFNHGECSALSVPTHTMHKTYLIVEKKNGQFNLYWVNRPSVSLKQGMSLERTLEQIRSMLDERFPFMDIQKMMDYPVKSNKPSFSENLNYASILHQGNGTNCVVSNLFGMLEALDQIKGIDKKTTQLRYTTVRKALTKDYRFYQTGFHPFTNLEGAFARIERYPNAAI